MAFIKPVTDQVGITFTNLYNIFVTYILPILQQVAAFVMGQLKTAWDQIIASINTITAVLSPYISQTQLLQVVLYALLIPLGLVVGAIVGFIAIVTTVIVIVARVIGFISSLIAAYFQLSAAVTAAMAQFVGAVVGGFNTAIGWMNKLPQTIQGVFAGAGDWLVSAGKNIVNGLINGIKSAIGGAISAASDLASSVTKAAQSALNIHSPSRVFADIGKNVVLGFAQGIDNNAALASNSMGSMLGSVGGQGTSSPSGSLGSLDSAQMKGGNSIVNNINSITIGSEVDADRVIQRLTGDQEVIGKGLVPQTRYA